MKNKLRAAADRNRKTLSAAALFSLTVQGGAVPPKAAPDPYRLRNALRENSVQRQLSEEIHGSGYPAGYAPIKCIQ